nr:site-specific integrase [Clostridium algifaecis]
MVAVNVCDIVDPPKSTPIKIKYWNADEVPFYLQKLKSTELYPLIFVAVSTGLREGELLALQWDDIDMINGTVKINKTLSRLNGKLVLKEPKTENSKREVVLLDSTIIFLKTLKKKAMEQKLEHGIDLNYVFRKKDGSIYRPEFISKRFRQLCSENNIPSIRFHDLRHTHATMMLKLGVNEKVISERLGHSRVSFTLDTYTHVDTTMQRDEIQKLNRIL